jgi:lipopolysaccharide exporter
MSTDASDTATVGESALPPARQVGRGVLWAAGTNIFLRLAGIMVTALLARLLSPSEFGVFAVALAVFAVVSSLAELGMGSAVSRSRDEPSDIAPTVTTLAWGTSLGLGVAMYAGAGLLARLLEVPDAVGPLRILSLSLVLTGLFAVPGAQLTREFRQNRIFGATVAGFVPANLLLVGLALAGFGAEAFAWSRVVGQLVTGAVMIAGLTRVYWPGWRRASVLSLLGFGLPLSLANLVNWSLLNADYVLIAPLLGERQVGIYLIAFSVASWTTAVLSSVLNGVVVPTFGRVVHDPRQLGEALVGATRLVALVACPIVLVTMVLADPLVHTVFGARWAAAAPVLVVLAVYGFVYSFTLLYANVMIALGFTTRLLLVQVGWIAVLVPALLLGIDRAGLVGAAWAHVVAVLLVALPGYLFFSLRQTELNPVDLLPGTVRPLAAASAAAGAAWAVGAVVDSDVLTVVLGGSLAVGVYALGVRHILLEQLAGMRHPSEDEESPGVDETAGPADDREGTCG